MCKAFNIHLLHQLHGAHNGLHVSLPDGYCVSVNIVATRPLFDIQIKFLTTLSHLTYLVYSEIHHNTGAKYCQNFLYLDLKNHPHVDPLNL